MGIKAHPKQTKRLLINALLLLYGTHTTSTR